MLHKKGLEFALDECLSCLEKGESLEDCLAQYPGLAAELEPLLRVALRTQQLRGSHARPEGALADGRGEFLRKAALLRAERERSHQGILSRLSDRLRAVGTGLSMRRGTLTIAVTVMLLFSLLGGGTIASANSLPGDLLYPLKRASEQVQLALTFGEETKAELRNSFDERRLEEVRTVVGVRRTVSVRFKGTLERTHGNVWIVSGLELVVDANAEIVGTPLVGREVHVEARTQTDGLVVARYVRVMEPVESRPTQTPIPPTATPTATAKPTETTELVPTPTPAEPTKEPTATQAPSEMKPKPTATEEPTPTIEPTGTLAITPTPVPAEAEPTREPPPREVKVKFEGQITEISSAIWVIGEYSVLTDSDTQVQEKNGRAEVGAWALVRALRLQDDSLLALEIIIERPSETPGEPIEFRGVIEQIGDAEWVIEGKSVRVSEETVVEGTPKVGSLAEVKGLRLGDGSIIAQHIVIKPPELQEVEFEGVIESFSETEWVVGGHSIAIDGATTIEGVPAAGLTAEVKAVLLLDGTILARHIRVEALDPEPSPTPTTAATPTPTATATPTSEPPQGAPTEEVPGSTATPQPPADTKIEMVAHRARTE